MIGVSSPLFDSEAQAQAWADAFSADPVNRHGYGVYGMRVRHRFVCTECDSVHSTLARAAACHYGIAGVLDKWQATCSTGSSAD